MDLKFPILVSEIKQTLPHRPPAVWIDEVLWAKAESENSSRDSLSRWEGECRVRLHPESHYASGEFVRSSTYIEWIAQAYGYVTACGEQIQRNSFGYQRTYLVGIQNCEIHEPNLKSTGEVLVHVKCSHILGPIMMIDGVVKGDLGKVLARAKLKIFAEILSQ